MKSDEKNKKENKREEKAEKMPIKGSPKIPPAKMYPNISRGSI